MILTGQKSKECRFCHYRYFYAFILVLLSFVVLSAFIKFSNINSFEKALFEDMLTGSAYKPFVTRVLTPWLTLGIGALIPDRWAELVRGWISESHVLSVVIQEYRAPENLGLEAVINIFLQLCSVLGFFYFFIKLARTCMHLTKKNELFILFFAFVWLLSFFNFAYIYDLPQLFLCTLAFYFIASRNTVLYLLVFICAILNKETSIVLIIPSIILFWDLSKPNIQKVIFGLSSQVFIYSLVRLPLFYYYRDNPGDNMALHFLDHIAAIGNLPVFSIVYFLAVVLVGITFYKGWKDKPIIVNLGVCSGCVLFILFLIGGYPFEFRVFYEVYGIFVISITWSFLSMRGFPIKIKSQETRKFIESCGALTKKNNSTGKPTSG